MIDGELDADGVLRGTITLGAGSERPMQMKMVGQPVGRAASSEATGAARRRVTTARTSAAGFRSLLAALLLAAPLAVACGESSMSQFKALVRASFPGVPQMSIEELDRRLEDDPPPLVIDVREPFEYEVSHLPGAVHAQGDNIAELVAETAPDRPIVLYCSVGYRSSAAVADLIQLNDPDLGTTGSGTSRARSSSGPTRDVPCIADRRR